MSCRSKVPAEGPTNKLTKRFLFWGAERIEVLRIAARAKAGKFPCASPSVVISVPIPLACRQYWAINLVSCCHVARFRIALSLRIELSRTLLFLSFLMETFLPITGRVIRKQGDLLPPLVILVNFLNVMDVRGDVKRTSPLIGNVSRTNPR